jgi:hypothetical protein
MLLAKSRKRLAVSMRAAQKIDNERFNVKMLNEGDVKEQYQVTIRNKFAALENSEESGEFNGVWDTIRNNFIISAEVCLGYYETKHLKPWCDEERTELEHRRRPSKLQWYHSPSEENEDYMSVIRREVIRQFRYKER